MLQVGSTGSDVRNLQKTLRKSGYSPGGVDGIFGPKTRAAVLKYQRAKNLAVDGIVGPQTGSRLFKSRNADKWDGAGGGVSGSSGPRATNFPSGGSSSAKLAYASNLARKLGLTITSTTGGQHAPGSYHYSGRAIDVAGSPSQMAAFYRTLSRTSPTELFYDPLGGMKYGNNIGAIGGHGDHVHVAY